MFSNLSSHLQLLDLLHQQIVLSPDVNSLLLQKGILGLKFLQFSFDRSKLCIFCPEIEILLQEISYFLQLLLVSLFIYFEAGEDLIKILVVDVCLTLLELRGGFERFTLLEDVLHEMRRAVLAVRV